MNKQTHVLLIDDEKNYLLVLETLLTEKGYKITTLNDPEMALAFLEESEVDVVVTDMKMPRLSGRDVLDRVADPFFTTKEEGTGLGLAIVHSIITTHGGHLRLENVEQGGAVVIIQLPSA